MSISEEFANRQNSILLQYDLLQWVGEGVIGYDDWQSFIYLSPVIWFFQININMNTICVKHVIAYVILSL